MQLWQRIVGLTLGLLLLQTVAVRGQDLEKKDDFGAKIDIRLFNRPLELVVETGGRTAACDVLRFTPDGKKLIATGDDKVVRIWPFSVTNGLNQEDARTLRWASFLQQRGSIYTLATDFERERVVVAGFGLRTPAVAVISIKERQEGKEDKYGTVLAGITPDNCPTWTAAQTKNPWDAFDGTVWSMAISRDGNDVVIGLERGRVFLWTPGKHDSLRPLGTIPGTVPGQANHVRHLHYKDSNTVVALASNGQVCEWDTREKEETKPRSLFQFKGRNLHRAAYDPVNKRLAAYSAGNGEEKGALEIYDLTGTNLHTFDLPRDQVFQGLSFDPRGDRLVAGYTIQPRNATFNKITGGGLLIYDLTQQKPQGREGPANSYYPDAFAFHPTDPNILAVAGGQDHEVVVYNLKTNEAISTVTSGGNCAWSVAFSGDDKARYIGLRNGRVANPKHPNARGTGSWRVFDRLKMNWVPDKEQDTFKPLEAIDSLGGWEIITSTEGYKNDDPERPTAFRWKVKDPNGKEFALPTIEIEDRHPRCYTFIKGSPVRLAVGHYWGATIYELQPGVAPKVVRKLVGHQGEVVALAASADGDLLLTASRDQTLAVWGLWDFKGHPALGADFQLNENVLQVKSVAVGSPAWEAGLVVGDEVIQLGVGLNWAKREMWEKELQNPRPGVTLLFHLRRQGKNVVKTLTSLKQRPLFVFFPQQNKEWALWRYYGYKYNCSTNGDSAIGWQLSRDVDATPRFDRAEQYRKKFYQPDEMYVFMGNLKLPPDRTNVLDLSAPDVRITPETDIVRDKEFKVLFTAKSVGDLYAHKVKAVEVWINDHHRYIQELTTPQDGFNDEITIPSSLLRQGENLITLHAFNAVEMRSVRTVKVRVPPGKSALPNLYVLSVGINNYKDADNLRPLRAVKDAEGILTAWSEQASRKKPTAPDEPDTRIFEKVARATLLTDKTATRAKILEELEAIAKDPNLKADDVLLVFLAGHGTSDSDLSSDIPEKRGLRNVNVIEKLDRDTFIFCTQDIDLAKPRSTGLSGKDIYLALRKLPCRKVVLLDTCHSGTVGRDPIRAMTPTGVGPFIVSACLPDQEAAEDETLGKNFARGQATGLFSISLIQVLTRSREFDKADGLVDKSRKDGKLDVAELGRYLEINVPALLVESTGQQSSTKSSELQTPAIFLPPLERQLYLAATDKKK